MILRYVAVHDGEDPRIEVYRVHEFFTVGGTAMAKVSLVGFIENGLVIHREQNQDQDLPAMAFALHRLHESLELAYSELASFLFRHIAKLFRVFNECREYMEKKECGSNT